ncbi:aminotransferase class V-fold PLP-dependent enzyme [Paenibacillus sp. LMG 31460]|uniref:Aminotransferase class V-fold PLP-dependent enzyme n=1 Tax=Paenibacillus germinis TaxID=2654979 RepID=A0ABX1ZC73_9BACL|nr:aminotransferase class V-fold PLP-dependent enzyme [Paenibacillus germinis]NOU90933.1 aminotransferase class V-fold PLP-dependent enzyme [Paenibacillus germinis]
MDSIQLFKPSYHIQACLDEIRDCLEKGWTGLGYKTEELEKKWMAYTGLPHAHYVNSATAGLHLAVKILKDTYGWQDGDEIISTPITFVSTNLAILYEKLEVVFADVDDQLCLDPADVERKISARTKAIMFVGYGGNTGQYERIVELCQQKGLKLILDAAHMAGSRLNGVIPGKEADAVVYSFQAVKNLPTGDSGMVCFREQEHDRICRKLSWLGIDKDTYSRFQGNYKWKYDLIDLGYKYHGNAIMAAIGLVQLLYLDQDNAYRRQIASWYDELLEEHATVETIPIAANCISSRHLYVIRSEDRDGLLVHLNRSGIFPGVHYRDNTEYPLFNKHDANCPKAAELSQMIISLPLHLGLTRTDVERVCHAIKAYIPHYEN